MNFDDHANLAVATVSVGSSVIATADPGTLVADSDETASFFPAPPFNITVWRDPAPAFPAAEIMRVTAFDGVRTFTVERAQEGTTALATITRGWRFANTITAGDVAAIEDAVNAEEAARVAEDATLQGEITAEAAARVAGDAATLASAETYTDAETTARQAAVTAEANARANADALLALLTDPRFTDTRTPTDGTVTAAKLAAALAILAAPGTGKGLFGDPATGLVSALGGLALIATTTLGADAASIDFTNIPQTYSRLLVLLRVRTDEAAAQRSSMAVALNNDTTAAHYGNARIFGIPGVVSGDANAANRNLIFAPGDAADANTYGTALILIGGYRDAAIKQVCSLYWCISALATLQFAMGTNVVGSNIAAAITRLAFSPSNGGNLRAGSVGSVYGIGT